MKKESGHTFIILTIFLICVLHIPVTAQTEEGSVFWVERSFRYIEAMGKAGGIVIAPVAQIEAHGPHLPVGTDYYIVEEIAERAARKSGAIVGPPVLLGNCVDFSCWPGYVLVDNDVFVSIIKNYCRSIEAHGFKKLIFLVEHSGANLNGIRTAVEENGRINPQMEIIVKTTEMLLGQEVRKFRKPNFNMDTAIMLAIRPDMVKMDRLPDKVELKSVSEGQTLKDMAPDALFVLPTASTAKDGNEILNIVVANMVKLIVN
jgi:creatinine amidohydrolase